MDTDEQNEDCRRLHQLITGTEDIKDFIDGMTGYAATTLSRVTGARVECAVTLRRRKRALTIAGSCEDAILLDGIEQAIGEGPTQAALEASEPVTRSDAGTEQRWPDYCKDLKTASVTSVLAVPLALGEDAAAALNFFAAQTGLFTDEVVTEAAVFAGIATQALKLSLRIATADLLATELKAAMASRTAIEFLHRASQNRSQKLHDLALGIISAHSGQTEVTSTFDDEPAHQPPAGRPGIDPAICGYLAVGSSRPSKAASNQGAK